MSTVKEPVVIDAGLYSLLLEMYRREKEDLPPLDINDVAGARALMEEKLIICRVWEKTEPHYIGCHLTESGLKYVISAIAEKNDNQ
jgi:hypothetical protein